LLELIPFISKKINSLNFYKIDNIYEQENLENYKTNTQKSIHYSGVVDSDGFCYTLLYLIVIKVKITYKNIYPSNYSKYQEKLYNRIKKYKDHKVGLPLKKFTVS